MARNAFWTILGLSALLTAGAAAQQPVSTLPSADQQYLVTNAQGSVADEATAETGVQQAFSPDVQRYAATVMADHSRLNKELLTVARKKGVIVPVTLSEDDKSKLTALQGQTGAAFDQAFLAEEVQVNGQDVQDAQKELSATSDADVRKFVQDFLSTEQKHLARAQALQQKQSAGPAAR